MRRNLPHGSPVPPLAHSEDLSDNLIITREDLCIGCGVCASNCPKEAITLEKVRDIVPVKNQAEMEQKFKEVRVH